MPYWLLSLNTGRGRRDAAWETLQQESQGLSINAKLDVPELRCGTLDTLMQLSDDLAKSSNLVEAVVNKIKRQVVESGGPGGLVQLKVDNMLPDSYVTKFKWDEAKHPSRRPLKETVDKISEIIARIEDDLKVKVSEYNTLKSSLNAIARKQTGSLSVRDISTLVKPQNVVESENLTTVFVVIQKFGLQEWQATYEKFCNFVVPRSSKILSEDQDYVLVNVVLFKRCLDDFKAAARSKGYQVREYQPPAEGGEMSAAQAEQLKRDVESKRSALDTWCKTAFGEAFSAWMHIMVIRLFVESILRYGLPPAFQAVAVKPFEKSENKLRTLLGTAFGDGKSALWKDDGSNLGAGLAGDTELFPYVSFTMNIDSQL